MGDEEVGKGFVSPETSKPPSLKLPDPFLGQNGVLTAEAKSSLEKQTKGFLERVPRIGGNGKDVYRNKQANEVVLVTTTQDKTSIPFKQFREQIQFYEKFGADETFRKTVVPLERTIEDKSGEAVGMTQKYFGVGMDEFLKAGGVISQAKILELVENYKELIEKTGIAHGNLVSGKFKGEWFGNWDNIRINTQTGEIKFIDYNGRRGGIDYDGGYFRPGDDGYEKVLKTEPERLKEALFELFGYKAMSLLLQRAA